MRYRSLTVFSLGPWAARIQTEFLVLRSTWDWVSEGPGFRLRGFHALRLAFPTRFD